ncbi:hypothetical protein FBBAL38_07075 [Flavobacteria bacterium BAL38]|jgi:hypothetical protein|uniref:hypothetical protein n=1 Tax=Flavobacterium sp. TaxID=239 RepID=UPI0000F3A1DA|nr:hypothetical protein FBBAL38_07075 [Flavobacteria bacterium BAL38]
MNRKKQFIIVILIIVLVSLFAYYDKSNLKRGGVFVIGKVVKNTHGKGYDGLYFKFNYKNNEYNEWCFTRSEGIVGKSYFCIVDDNNLKKSILLVDCPVPDSITKSPYNGWKKIPIPDYQLILDNYFKSNTERFFDF